MVKIRNDLQILKVPADGKRVNFEEVSVSIEITMSVSGSIKAKKLEFLVYVRRGRKHEINKKSVRIHEISTG